MFFVACNDKSESNPTYTVTFKVDGRDYDVVAVEEGKAVTLPTAPQKDGYTFLGWFNRDDNVVTVVNEDVTLTAKWTVNTYTITYTNTNGVENVNPTSFTVEDGTIEIADLEDTLNETFLGWSFMNGTPVKGCTITYNTKYIYNSLDMQGKLYFDEKGNLFFDSDEGLRLTRYRSDELTYTIPSDVDIIDDYAFQGRSDMQSITWSDSIKSIGESAFEGCGGITSLNVTTEGLTIGEAAFYECPSITEFTVSADNVTIGELAFRKCPNLVSVSLTGKGLEIKYDAFYECSSLENVRIAVENSKFQSSVFSKTALKSVAIYGDGVQLYNTFAYSAVQEVEFNANNITATGYLFRGAQSLKTVTVNGNNVQFIGNWNFDDCSNLTDVIINGSVTAIGDN